MWRRTTWRNCLIWYEEVLTRRDNLSAVRIQEAKRTIDRHNQWRNDAIEAMNTALLALLPPPRPDAPVHSESPGMMLDRLWILALREYHLEDEATREDASPEHRASAEEKLGFVREQREVLTRCLDGLLNAPEGRRFFRFRACTLYNDPATSPQLYAPDSRLCQQDTLKLRSISDIRSSWRSLLDLSTDPA
jgi:hypothetical protein